MTKQTPRSPRPRPVEWSETERLAKRLRRVVTDFADWHKWKAEQRERQDRD